ncbi:HNH endonuclease signature motif containing protein [Mitsuaria sp. 7]|uniref:HNH endonuclease signature motif containing protein n=1 Tax=Mitsuaria sp. 7 TaxID=1658665 RepID=UPI0008350B67|nr:HNH endonuclease signature motif containing protein [Mitsuaria sp. 7]
MKIWKLMAHDERPAKEAFAEHVARGYIAVGWTEAGDMAAIKPSSVDDIKPHVYATFEQKKNLNGPPSLWSFFSLMQVGDYVVEVGDGKRLGVFRVTGRYEYLEPPSRVAGYAHVRSAELTEIDPDALWRACGEEGRAFAPKENPQGTLVALKATAAAQEILRAHEALGSAGAARTSDKVVPTFAGWDAWSTSDQCVADWQDAGEGLEWLLPAGAPKSDPQDESKPGRASPVPALWVYLDTPLHGLHRVSFALVGEGATLGIECKVWVLSQHEELYRRFIASPPFLRGQAHEQVNKHSFRVEVRGIKHAVALRGIGAPGEPTLRAVFETFVRYVLASHEGSPPPSLLPIPPAGGPSPGDEPASWVRDEAAMSEIDQLPLNATEKLVLAKARIQQSDYRARLLERWGHACSVSGLGRPGLLIASHIHRWTDCKTAKDRWSADNGLLLHPGLDKAFETGLISFDDDGRIILSEEAQGREVQEALGIKADAEIRDFGRFPGLRAYLRQHRERHATKLGLAVESVAAGVIANERSATYTE